MSEVTVKWLEARRFVGVDSTDHGIVISTPAEEGRIGVKPSDLLLLALGSCTAHDVVGILIKKRQALAGLEVRVTGVQDAEPPWTFRSFHIHYRVTGDNLSEKAVADAIALSEEKYCSVGATLRQAATLTHDYEIVQTSIPASSQA